MSISYHGIVGFGSGKSILPSVETWGNNMNILRDPPKSIFTRKIDKVGETSEITQMIQDSGDRACEAINVYARGVNPMVAVSYDNYGNNGGQKSGSVSSQGINISGGNKQAYLPYRIMDRGAFRPPVKDQRDLLPLSRLPRVWTSSFTQPGFADFSKKALCPGGNYREVKNEDQMLKACIRPTATYQIETPIIENYEVKHVIKNPISIEGFSGIQPTARFNGEIGDPAKGIQDILYSEINVNQNGEYKQDMELSHFDTEKYTHEVLHGNINSNISQNIEVTPIDEIFDTSMIKTKNNYNISYMFPQSSYERNNFNTEMNLERNLPIHESRTNIGRNIHHTSSNNTSERNYEQNRPTPSVTTNIGGYTARDDISSRSYSLRPTVNPGGFDPVPTMPSVYRENQIQEFDNQKLRMRRSIYEMQQDRNISLGNIPFSVQETRV